MNTTDLKALKYILIFLAALVAMMLLAGCGPVRHRVKHKAVKVHHLADGRYCYQDDGIYYFFMFGRDNMYYINQANTFALPSGHWSTTDDNAPGVTATAYASAPESVETIAVQANGQPFTEAQIEAEGRDGVDVSETGEGDSTSSDSSDAGGDDAGGGDGGGGGE